MILKGFLVRLLICLGEVLNGNLRVRYLRRKFGRRRAKDLSFASGMILLFLCPSGRFPLR